MKKICFLFLLAVLSLCQLHAQSPVIGAWKSTNGDNTSLLLITPAYFTITTYNNDGFKATKGGTWEGSSENAGITTVEFNSEDSTQVGKQIEATIGFEGEQLVLIHGTHKATWTRIDDGNGLMSGVWQITGREANGQMNAMKPGPRKTIKVLTGTKFQWIAMNTETGQFFGTGGGTYTFKDGIYTEKIEFFSRDNSRVGASLSFKGSLNGNSWDHSGKSSKGDPIHEEWTRK